ncbi:unnamed protein product [Absidia cylindrospora]
MTSFASTLSHPDWKFWILATPSGSGPDVVDLEEVINEEEPATTEPDSMSYLALNVYFIFIEIIIFILLFEQSDRMNYFLFHFDQS